MASTAAVDGLTNILLQTMLFPERGNPVVSHFVVKHREMSTDFLSTQYVLSELTTTLIFVFTLTLFFESNKTDLFIFMYLFS